MSVDAISPERGIEEPLDSSLALDALKEAFNPPMETAPSHSTPIASTRTANTTLTKEELQALFPNLTPEEQLEVFPLFSSEDKSFLYKGTSAQQFAQHLNSMLLVTHKMRAYAEEQMEQDKASLQKILESKLDNQKALLAYQAKKDKWEWTKHVFDCLSLTIAGISTLTHLYAYWTAGPAAPPLIYAAEAAFGTVCSIASMIIRTKKPEDVKLSMTLSTLALVISMHQWYANVAVYQHLLGPELANIDRQVHLFGKNFIEGVKSLAAYQEGMGETKIMKAQAKALLQNQKFQKKGAAVGEGLAKHTIADKHFSGFIRIASNALEQLTHIKKRTNQGG